MTFWDILVRFLLCCPLYLLASPAVIKSSDTNSCNSEKGITITHVYSSGEDGSEPVQAIQTDDQNLVFKHHIRLQMPAADCEKNDLLAALLARLSSLEEEMMGLKDEYQGCCGAAGRISVCGVNGKYIRDLDKCQCDDGWEGPDCSLNNCPNNCAGNGICINGICQCAEGFTGPDCRVKKCAYDCGEFGKCVDGSCQCAGGYTGPDCKVKKCAYDCGEFGKCIDGSCQCADGYTGADCRGKKCAYDCGKFGKCIDGSCQCAEGYIGPACRKKKCPVDCGEFGKCIDGTCKCSEGYTGLDCKEKKCSVECRPNGRCVNGQCICNEGFIGISCSTDIGSLCNGHGKYLILSGTCQCDDGWEGPDCSQKSCPNNCGGNGICIDGVCQCASGFVGPDCREKECALDCGEHGTCVNGACQCVVGYTGVNCREEDCPVSCGENGRCDGGMCFCEEGFIGESCSEVMAVQNLRLIGSTEDSLNIGWDLVIEADYYLIIYYPYNKEGLKKQIKVSRDQDSEMLLNLNSGTLYKIFMYQVKNGVTSQPAELEARTEDSSLGTLWMIDETEDSLEVEWENPQNEIDYFNLRYAAQGQGAVSEVMVPRSKDRKSRYIITGLQPSTQYEISVRSVRGTREGKASTVTGTTGIDGPKNLVTTEVGEDTATLSWEGARGQIDKYILTYSSLDGVTEELDVDKGMTTTSLSGLIPGMKYSFELWAERGGKRSKRATTTATTDIDAPTNLQASDVTQTEATLTWTPPIAQIDGYTLTYEDSNGVSQEIQLDAATKSYKLQGLRKGLKYTVYLTAYKGDRRSRRTITYFLTLYMIITHATDCSQVMLGGNQKSGVYTIYPGGDTEKGVKVYCDQTTDGGGWLVFQRRNSGKLDFYQRWRTYVEGFGDPSDEFWIGLDWLHKITALPANYELRVDLRSEDESVYAKYTTFRVGSSKDRYRLTISGYSGDAGDALTYHNGWKFTTWDKDNDIALTNCALSHRGAFWYKNCHLANLNGRYGETSHSQGINWKPWKGHEYSIPFAEMKIRPNLAALDNA